MAVALITGTSSGIGKLTALELARQGHRVFASLRNLDSARYVLAAVEKENLSVDFVQLDVTDPRSVNTAIDYVMQREGRLDILVNNARFGSFGPVEDYTDDEIRLLFETNLFGAVRTTRAVLPAMRAPRSGTIIMLSSISGLRTFPFMSMYSASKFALEAISNGLRYELRPWAFTWSSSSPEISELGRVSTCTIRNVSEMAQLRARVIHCTSDSSRNIGK